MTKYEYDDYGRQHKLIDANGGTSVYSYNAYGLLSGQTDPLGQTSAFHYDLAGRCTTKTVAAPPAKRSVFATLQ